MFRNVGLDTSAGPKWAVEQKSLQREINRQNANWYENFTFENGARSFGRSPSDSKLYALGLPQNLAGVKVLDVGTYEGFYAFHLEQRGALVTPNDHFVWNYPGDPSLEHFKFVKEATGSRLSPFECQIEDLPEKEWDLTLFLGVLYHLEDQLAALRKIRQTSKNLVILETLVDNLDVPGPSLKYYPGASLNGDPTNNFGPNLEALFGLIQAAGFSRWEFKSLWEWNTNKTLSGQPSFSPLQNGRVVIWCWV
jgi:tRNA (mo5U34)-methyltransferase